MANDFPILSGVLQGNLNAAGHTVVNLSGLNFGSTSTGITLHNTADEVTNYERASLSWQSNIFKLQLSAGGTGVPRTLQLVTSHASAAVVEDCVSILPTINQSGTGGYRALLVNVTESATGSGSKRLIDLQVGGASKFLIQTDGATILGDPNNTAGTSIILNGGQATATGSVCQITFRGKDSGASTQTYSTLTVACISPTAGAEIGAMRFGVQNGALTNRVFEVNGSGYCLIPATYGLQLHNTADEVTDYERANLFWSSNVFTIGVEKGGAGLGRHLAIVISGDQAAAGVQNLVSILPTVAQSGTAGYTALLLNVTESSTGSGQKNLVDFQIGGTSSFRIDSTGLAVILGNSTSLFVGGSLLTNAPISLYNGTVPTVNWRHGAGGADAKNWDIRAGANKFEGRILDDARSATIVWFEAARTATTTFNRFQLCSGVFGVNIAAGVTPSARIHVKEATVGSMILKLESTTAGDPVVEEKTHYRVTTTDATVTPIATIALTASRTYKIHAKVFARRTGGVSGTAEDSFGYFIRGTFKTVAGTAVLVGALVADTPQEDQAGFDATLAVSAGNVLLNVTGAAANNVTWHATVELSYVGT